MTNGPNTTPTTTPTTKSNMVSLLVSDRGTARKLFSAFETIPTDIAECGVSPEDNQESE